jgi:hypothetical protein
MNGVSRGIVRVLSSAYLPDISKPVLHIKRTHENNSDNVCSRFSRNCIVSPSKLGLSFSIISLTNNF